MATLNKFGTTRLLDPANRQFHGQERVNAEIFTAMEILGRKLERVESERDRLARRLSQIESAATIDEKTGKFYLPVAVEQARALQAEAGAAPKWVMASALTGCLVAFFALGLVLFQNPAPALTKEQLALLDSLKAPQLALAGTADRPWKSFAAAAPQMIDAPPPETALSAAEIAAAPPVVETAPVENVVSQAAPVAATPVTASAEPLPDTALPARLQQLENRAYQGIPEAQHDLAALYASGRQVPRNYTRALYWFGKAADGGVANAHYNLGVIHQQGLGVKRNARQAVGWYEKAAELGHPEAMYNLGIAYIEGIGVKANITRGAAYFKRAANAGVTQAAYNLGVIYETNFAGSADAGQAMKWYEIAAAKGHADAINALGRITTMAGQASTLADTVEPAAGGMNR